MKKKVFEFELTGADMPYHLKAPNLPVAAVAALMLGNGKYGVKGLAKNMRDHEMPILTEPGQGDKWSRETLGMDLMDVVEKVSRSFVLDLQRALGSVRLGRPGENPSIKPVHDLEAIAQETAGKVARELRSSIRRRNTPMIH